MSKRLPPPPRFIQSNTPPGRQPDGSEILIGPQNTREWDQLYRWFLALWSVVAPIIPGPPPSPGIESLNTREAGDFPPPGLLAVGAAASDGGSSFAIAAPAVPSSSCAPSIPPSPAPQPPYQSRRPLEIITCTQATFPTLTGQVPVFVYVTDYPHFIFWDGSTFTFADGGSAYLGLFEADPGAGWHLYDGATVSYLKADGTLGTQALPDLTSSGALAAYLKAGGANSGPNAAVAPTLAMDPFTPAGSVVSIFTGNLINFTTALFVATAGAVAALVSPTSITPSGSILSAFTGTPDTPTGTISSTGEPRNLVRRPYFRQ